MNGEYEYPGLKLILTRLDSGEEPAEGQPIQKFIDGQREQDTHVSFFMRKLPAGDYVLMYQSEFGEETKDRKLVVSCYSDWQMNFKRINTDGYDPSNYKNMERALFNRVMDRQNDPPEEEIKMNIPNSGR